MIVEMENGFVCEIDEDCLNDMETLEEVAKIEEGEVWKVGTVLERMVGTEKKKELYNLLRNEKGRVPIERVSEAFEKLVNSLNNGKNS